jgi:hypothetical protein
MRPQECPVTAVAGSAVKDVAEIVSIWQLSPGTKSIQYHVLNLAYKEVNNIKL